MSIYEIPHKFIAGTKAVAVEVNENFEYVLSTLEKSENNLNNELISVKSDISRLENQSGDTIIRLKEVGPQVIFDSNTLIVNSGLRIKIPNGTGTPENGESQSENRYLEYTLPNTITKEYVTQAVNSVISLDNQGEIHEYSSYIEAQSEPGDPAPVLYFNTDSNIMYKKINDEEGYVQCFELKIADGFNRGEDGTITAINSVINPIIALGSDTIHTAEIKVDAILNLPILANDNDFINTMLEFTLDNGVSLTLPNNIIYSGGEIPELVADGITLNRLIFDTTTGGKNWMCYFSSNAE